MPRQVGLAVGGIPMQSKTCGDSYFARLCYHHGCEMVYVPDAIVRHPTRRIADLLRKAKLIATANARGGGFDVHTRRRAEYDCLSGWRRFLVMPHFRALNPWLIDQHLRARNIPARPSLIFRTWCAAVGTLTWGAGIALVAQSAFRVAKAMRLRHQLS